MQHAAVKVHTSCASDSPAGEWNSPHMMLARGSEQFGACELQSRPMGMHRADMHPLRGVSMLTRSPPYGRQLRFRTLIAAVQSFKRHTLIGPKRPWGISNDAFRIRKLKRHPGLNRT